MNDNKKRRNISIYKGYYPANQFVFDFNICPKTNK